ncbi:MAG: hypothetical protein DRI57_22855 [Deltaproteobacteria bacterium]|nr:MAG: hypothetical protein DRI57_22855 [Deltaproteobacteria bacterium]
MVSKKQIADFLLGFSHALIAAGVFFAARIEAYSLVWLLLLAFVANWGASVYYMERGNDA